MSGGMVEAGELPHGACGRRWSTATRSPCRSPTTSFDCIIASEVLEHVWADEDAIGELVRVLRPGGRMAVTVPDALARANLLGARPPVPRHPGRTRPHLPAARARGRSSSAPGSPARLAPRARAALAVLVLKCAVGVDNADAPGRPQVPRPPRVADHEAPRAGSGRSTATLNPVLGKSLVVYTEKVG